MNAATMDHEGSCRLTGNGEAGTSALEFDRAALGSVSNQYQRVGIQ